MTNETPPATDGFAETKKQMDDDATAHSDECALEAKAIASEEQAVAKAKEARDARDQVELRRLRGETLSAAKFDQAVRDADSEVDAARRTVAITGDRRRATAAVLGESTVVHSKWATGRCHLTLADDVTLLGKIGRQFE